MKPTQTEYKILLWNLGYATHLTGSFLGYLFGFYRYLYTPARVVESVRRSIDDVMEREQPDLCCFAEMCKNGHLIPRLSMHASQHVDNKYGPHSLLRRLPFFRSCCNGFWGRSAMKFRKTFFRHGTKKLIYDIKLGARLRVLFVHMSLSRHVRKAQCEELRRMVKNHPETILCGDFNTLHGTGELDALTAATGLRMISTPSHPTFPAIHPRKTLDLFLCPQGIDAEVKVIDEARASDHLPVLLTLKMA